MPLNWVGATSKSVVYCVLCRALIDDGRPPNKAYCVQLAATLSVLFYPLMDKGLTEWSCCDAGCTVQIDQWSGRMVRLPDTANRAELSLAMGAGLVFAEARKEERF